MCKPVLAIMSTVAVGLLTVGCGSKSGQASASASGQTPDELLRWSMDQYHHAKSFTTGINLHVSSVAFGINLDRTRTFDYQSPNLYRVVTTLAPATTRITVVSDGTNEVDYSDNVKAKAMKNPAPAEFHTISSDPMIESAVSGSLLYDFFGGSENVGELEQQGGEKATWGPDGTAPNGEPTKTVHFMSTGTIKFMSTSATFGHVDATIGTKTGLVYKMAYDFEPLTTQLLKGHTRQDAIDELKKGIDGVPKGPKRDTVQKAIDMGPSVFDIKGVETFNNPKFDPAEELAIFRPNVPKGEAFSPPKPDGKAPVEVGARAPDITVRDGAGHAMKLSSLRGHVVLLDFWATWSNPCKATLPVTAALADKYGAKGLRVLAISSEEPGLVAQFVKQQTYKLPAFTDQEQAATYTYHIASLPTTVIIDAKGNLSDYLVGATPPDELQTALARAGLNMSS